MAHELTWSPAARLDLKEIFAYIAEDDPIAGKKFIRSLFIAVERLPVFPESGRVVPEFKDATIREIIHRPCRVVYRIKAGQNLIEIARVWHAARGIPQL
jgi:plasmid stabilization system protein ParE